MPLSAVTKLGRYEILVPIGAASMGEVYRALDPRLNRDVAIKVSAAQFSERLWSQSNRSTESSQHLPAFCGVGPNYL